MNIKIDYKQKDIVMNKFKTIILVAGFSMLAACGGGADKFTGDWVEPNPGEEKIVFGVNVNEPMQISIKATKSSEVEITQVISDTPRKNIYKVDGDMILNGPRVIYKLDGDKLVSSSGMVLVKK